MSRVFLVGAGPMMDGGACRVTAHAVRTWHFVTALRRAGHEVVVCTVSQTISPLDPVKGMIERRVKEDFAYENLDMRAGNMLAYLAERCSAIRPDGVVGVSTEPASWACRMRPTVPVWADLHGWVMAEAQLKAARDGNDDILSYFWQHERPVLRRADKISAVSNAQRFALLGELATVGRLNRHTAEYEFVVTIPSSIDPVKAEAGSERLEAGGEKLEAGEKQQLPASRLSFPASSLSPPASSLSLPASSLSPPASHFPPPTSFVVLWSGGFNTWADPITLFEGLDWAMERDPRIHFVATGGAIPGHADAVFDAFCERVNNSPHRARYHLAGWVAAEQFPAYLAAGHLAICADLPCLETSSGTRTRLVEAMAAGLPILMTRGTELSIELEREGIGWVVAPRDSRALGEKILELARDRERTARMGELSRQFVEQRYSIERTLEQLVRWAERPCFAPDNALKHAQSPAIFEAALNQLEANARALDDIANVQSLVQARRDLDRLRSRWPLRLWRWLRPR